jgi:Ca-activated chloride channel homolog
MNFALPSALSLLIAVPVLIGLWLWSRWRGRVQLARLGGAERWSSRLSGGKSRRHLISFTLEMIGLILLILGIARPQWGFTEKTVEGQGRSIIVAIDTSRSMLAADMAPNRLTRAKLAAQDLIASLPGDRIGLIAFAGKAFLQAPLTTDHEALLESLDQFDSDLIPRGGTNLSEAISLANETFSKANTSQQALIIFSDGDELEGEALKLARQAKEKNTLIISVGVGTTVGDLVPDPESPGQFIRDANGQPVRSRLQDRVLEALAKETAGLYLNLSNISQMKERLQTILSKLERARSSAKKESRTPIERYSWFVGPALACFLLAYLLRLGHRLKISWLPWSSEAASITRVVCVFFIGTISATAADSSADSRSLFEKIWPQSETNPWQSLQQQSWDQATTEFDQALESARHDKNKPQIQLGRGSALYKAGDLEEARESFAQALNSADRQTNIDAQYNLGNTFAAKAKATLTAKKKANIKTLKGAIKDVQQAISHYEDALRYDPQHPDATYNRDQLKKFLEKLQEKLQQKQQQKGQQGEGKKKGKQKGKGSGGQSGPPSDSSESGEPSDEEGEEDGDGEEGSGEEENEGEEGQAPGQGKSQGKQSGQNGKRKDNDRENAAPEGDEKERSGEQAEGNKLEAKAPGGNAQGEESNSDQAGGASKSQKQTRQFSRSEAKALLDRLSDEDHLPPLIDRAARDSSYKNW